MLSLCRAGAASLRSGAAPGWAQCAPGPGMSPAWCQPAAAPLGPELGLTSFVGGCFLYFWRFSSNLMPSRPPPVELPCCVPVPLQGPEKSAVALGCQERCISLGSPLPAPISAGQPRPRCPWPSAVPPWLKGVITLHLVAAVRMGGDIVGAAIGGVLPALTPAPGVAALVM